MAKSKFDKLSARWASGNPPDLKVGVVGGAAANTPIPLAGIKTDSVVAAAVALRAPDHTHTENTDAAYVQNATTGAASATGLVSSDRTAEVTVPSNGNVQFSVVTTGETILVFYWETS